jgi:hypothetical protein
MHEGNRDLATQVFEYQREKDHIAASQDLGHLTIHWKGRISTSASGL